jgi:hypothetical protein
MRGMFSTVIGIIVGILIDIPYSALITALLSLIHNNIVAYLLGYTIYLVSLVAIPISLAVLFSKKFGV